MQARHVCFRRRLPDKDRPLHFKPALCIFPFFTGLLDIGHLLLAGAQHLFLYKSLIAS